MLLFFFTHLHAHPVWGQLLICFVHWFRALVLFTETHAQDRADTSSTAVDSRKPLLCDQTGEVP